jgi:hypothetical protein
MHGGVINPVHGHKKIEPGIAARAHFQTPLSSSRKAAASFTNYFNFLYAF